ncbi:MAG: Csp1 family four helix bundle copper storage protein [Deltaproteobacteria bacterium]|nr:Csp1 family four helix bundle copper storage protein [Deltaproteobacteria bacterium]
MAAKATASTLACAKDKKMEEEALPTKKLPETPPKGDAKGGGEHAGHEGHGDAAGAPANEAFAAASADCTEKGQACLQHCIALLSKGDTSMAECAAAVHEMLAICNGVSVLALANSKHLKAGAALCQAVCSDCEAACKPHVGHHATCKACADACAAMIAEAKKLA